MREYITVRRSLADRTIDEQERASALFSPLCFDPDSGLFLCEDGFLAACFECQPTTGSDDRLLQQTTALMNDSYPGGTHMSFLLFRSPDINSQIRAMWKLRDNGNPAFNGVLEEKEMFLRSFTQKSIQIQNEGLHNLGAIFDLKLYVSVKFPIAGENPTAEEKSKYKDWSNKVETTLRNMGLAPRCLNATSWIRVMSTLLNWGEDASWQHENTSWDHRQTLNEQILDFHNSIAVSTEGLQIGSKYVRCLSTKRMPETMVFGEAQNIVGDTSGGYGGVRTNYAVCVNVFFPESDSRKQEVERKRQLAVNQAAKPTAALAPVLKDKAIDFNVMYESMNQGYRPVHVAYHVIIFANSGEELKEATMTARNFWRTNRFEIMEDKFIHLPIFLNCMPMNADTKAMIDYQRYKTMTSEMVVPLLPINGEWKGTGTSHVQMLSRNGQVMSLSLDENGNTNMNVVVTAASGSGKSVLVNEFVSSYMSCACPVWIIDVGRSYEKLCEVYGGTFIHFGADSDICLNPFETIISLDGTPATRDPSLTDVREEDDEGQEDAIMGILCAMAAPTIPLDDYQVSQLRRILFQCWTLTYRETQIDDIADACLADQDPRVMDIGAQLHAFTSRGSYGRFFNGKNNIKFDKQLIVLELEELKGRAHLQQVVLLQLILQIQDAIYLGDRRRSLVFIDESWDLLNKGDVSKFIEHAYRRMRKYGGGIGIATQSMLDLMGSAVGEAIIANTATQIYLYQKDHVLAKMQRDGLLPLSQYHVDVLKSVRTLRGVYAEIFVKNDTSIGVGRLVLSEFQKLLYSTNAADVRDITRFKSQGLSVAESIRAVMDERGRK